MNIHKDKICPKCKNFSYFYELDGEFKARNQCTCKNSEMISINLFTFLRENSLVYVKKSWLKKNMYLVRDLKTNLFTYVVEKPKFVYDFLEQSDIDIKHLYMLKLLNLKNHINPNIVNNITKLKNRWRFYV